MKKLTVMVSIYDSGQFLDNRIRNLLECTCLNDIEIWCVNADSPDADDDAIPQRYPVVYKKLSRRLTVYETWNYIIENSESEFITIANTDDIVAPDCYETLMATLNMGFDFTYCSWYQTTKPNEQWSTLTPGLRLDRPGHYKGDVERSGVGHFPMWRRSLHANLGLFDTEFKALSDADWWARCYFVGKAKFRWTDRPLGCYLWRNGQNLWNRAITGAEWQLYGSKLAKYKNGRPS